MMTKNDSWQWKIWRLKFQQQNFLATEYGDQKCGDWKTSNQKVGDQKASDWKFNNKKCDVWNLACGDPKCGNKNMTW